MNDLEQMSHLVAVATVLFLGGLLLAGSVIASIAWVVSR